MNSFHLLASLLVVALAASTSLTVAQDNTTTTTLAPTTTKAAPTTTKAAPTTTKPAPTTTTAPAVTNTTTAPTNKTTAKPTPSTTKGTTPAPATTTKAPAEPKNTFNGSDGTIMCIQLVAKIDFSIKYDKGKDGNVTKKIPVPGTFKSSATCGNKTQVLSIAFYKDWELKYTFQKDDSTHYHVSDVMLTYFLDSNFPGAKTPGAKMVVNITTGSDYMKGNEDGYICKSKIGKDSGDFTINTEDLKYKAFNTKSTISLKSTGLECSADEDTNSIVPIAVGAALAGLVVIVLIAYLIGRKRTRKTGYESV